MLAACGAPPDASTSVGESRSAIIAGQPSDSSQDFAVEIDFQDSSSCTGTLVAPDLVLTAQHCVTGVPDTSISGTCALPTDPISSTGLTQAVRFGPSAQNPTSTVGISRIFVDESNTDCSKDIAFVQLVTPVTSVTIHPLLLDSLPPLGEDVYEVGWGAVTIQLGLAPTRQQEAGKLVFVESGMAPLAPDGTPVKVPSGALVASITSCNGDSGAPLMDTEGNQLGVLSAAAGDKRVGSTIDCADDVSVVAPLSAVVPFVTNVFQAVGRMPWRAGRPAPPNDIGGACTLDNECNSNYCVKIAESSSGICSSTCTMGSGATGTSAATCPAPTVCTDFGGKAPVCLLPQAAPKPLGCSISRCDQPAHDPEGALVGGGATLALLAARGCRRKRRTPRTQA